MSIIERITSLRDLMLEKGIDAVLIYGTDPHLSEYVPDAWRSREWITGFTGSYGKVAITMNQAALWTDSRYFIQAEKQLAGSGILMIKDRQADTMAVDQWLMQQLKIGSTVAVDGLTISASEAKLLEQKLGAKGITFDIKTDLVSPLWKDRPHLPQGEIFDYSVTFAGLGRQEKLALIRNRLAGLGASSTIICQLDDLAWSFNLRGSDISYNPLFTGYGYVDQHKAILFIHDEKIPVGLIEELDREGVDVINYSSIISVLDNVLSSPVFIDPDRTNFLLYRFIQERSNVIEGLAIPTLLKSVKNEVEQNGMREAHIRDGVAMVNFLHWLDNNSEKQKITEQFIEEKLRSFRSEQLYFVGESFSSIVGFGPHGAIVHYSATAESNLKILPDGILLFDSGGQYLDGTTDLTRTIATGRVTDQQQSDFTLVLKGMIQLAKAIFPENTKGYSLDILARKALWNCGLNYGHGTGHGIGHYLSVHEGPMAIRQEYNGEPIREGQILSDEPGIYREGEYGIRIENVLLCKREFKTDFGNFLSFETLTLCPIDTKLMKRQLLTSEETEWINYYHARVLNELGPRLEPDVLRWLTVRCAPI